MKLETKLILNVTLSKEEVAQCVQLASIVCNSLPSTKITKSDGYDVRIVQYIEEFKKLHIELSRKNIDRIEAVMADCEKMNIIIGQDK